jgi:hypothetical protein
VILSNEYFQQRFGGDRSVIGKTLPTAAAFGPPPIIVGVLAPGFELLFPPKANMEQFPSVWIASRIQYDVENRNNVQWRVIARLKPDASLAQAQAEAEAVAQKIREENKISNTAGQFFQLVPMKQHLVDEVRPAILALMGAVIFLLLIACANVANLMLVTRTRAGGSRGAWRWLVAVDSANTRRSVRLSSSRNGDRSWACVFRYPTTARDRAGESASLERDRNRSAGVGVFCFGGIVVCCALWCDSGASHSETEPHGYTTRRRTDRRTQRCWFAQRGGSGGSCTGICAPHRIGVDVSHVR